MNRHASFIHRAAALALAAFVFLVAPRTSEASDRKGFVAGIGLGGGKISCEDCEGFSGIGTGFYLGAMLSEKLAIVFDGSAVAHEEDGATLYSVVAAPALQYWASPRVWVKGGIGSGQLSLRGDGLSEDSDAGLGFLGAVGVEIAQKKKIAVDLQFRFTTAKIEGVRVNNVIGLIGISFN